MRNFILSLIFMITACGTSPALADAVIFSGSDVKTLKANIDLFGQAKIMSGSVNPQSTATSAPIGSLYLNTITGDVYKKIDAGSSTNWTKLGADSSAITKNYVKNPFAVSSTSDVTASGGTLSRNTTSPLLPPADFLIDASASGQTYTWDSFNFDPVLKGGNCQSDFFYTGDGSLYKAYVNINSIKVSSDYALSNAGSNSIPVTMFYPCGDTSNPAKPVIESTSSAAAQINVVGVTSGGATKIGTVQQAVGFGSASVVGASGCIFSENSSSGSTNFVSLGTGSGCNTWTVDGSVTAQATNDHRIILNNAASGKYFFVLNGTFEAVSNNCYFRLSDGTTNTVAQYLASGLSMANSQFELSYSSPGTRTISIQAADDGAGSCRINANGAGADISWKVYYFPSSGQQVASVSSAPFFTDWTSYTPTFSAGWGTPTNVSMWWKRDGDSMRIKGSFNVGTAAASIGTITLPDVYTIDTAKMSSTSFKTSFGRIWRGASGTNDLTTGTGSIDLAAVYNGTSNLFQVARATSSVLYASENVSSSIANTGDLINIEELVIPISGWTSPSAPVPILVNSVSSNSTGAERIERLDFFINSGTPEITSQSGSWVTSLTDNGVGDTTINMASGLFSIAPTCVCTTAGNICTQAGGATTTSWRLKTMDVTGAGVDRQVTVMCMGPK